MAKFGPLRPCQSSPTEPSECCLMCVALCYATLCCVVLVRWLNFHKTWELFILSVQAPNFFYVNFR